MENNEIVRSLKFYCDAIFKYDYEKDKVFLYYDSNRPEYANNWFDTERIIEHYTSSYVFAADVHQASGNLSRESLRCFCEGEECCRAFEHKVRTKSGETAWYEVILQRQGMRNVLVSCRNIFTEVLNSSLKRVMDSILEDLLLIDAESGRYMTHINGIDLHPAADDGNYDRRPPEGCDCIEDKLIIFNGLRIAGLGGSRLYSGGKDQYSEREMKNRIWKLGWKIRRAGGVDIVVAHAPVRGVGDGDDYAHMGFEAFLPLLDRYKPRYFIHGHVHMEYGRDIARMLRRGDTTVINAYERYTLEV